MYANRYKKWQWIELDLVKNTSDFRPESFRPYNIDSEIKMLDVVDVSNNWEARRKIVLNNVYTNLGDLILDAKSEQCISLAVYKPSKILNFIWEPVEREWDSKKIEHIIAHNLQGSLFDAQEYKNIFKVVRKLPYKFSYVFETESGKTSTLMIEDWELGQLYWNMMDKYKNEEIACNKVKEKFFDYLVLKRDLYFFMGTTKRFHKVGESPFIIIGVFYPPKVKPSLQLSFDF